ncbi:MAG: hypothetical protein ABI703_03760, partial [Gemmatimonadales bacterium]
PLSLHRYLKSGGKIVNFSVPLGAVLRDSTGAVMGDEPSRMEQLGVPAATVERSTAMVWQRPGYATIGGIGLRAALGIWGYHRAVAGNPGCGGIRTATVT